MLAELSIALSGSIVLAIVFVAIAVVLAIVFYRTTLPPLPRGTRILLSSLRAAALSLLLLLLFEPVIRMIRHDAAQPSVAVLVDRSQSMSLVDAIGSRSAAAAQALRSVAGTLKLPGTAVEYYEFAGALSKPSADPPDSLRPDGETTDLGGALSAVRASMLERNTRAIVLLTDGEYTAGKSPLYAAESLGVPVFAIGVGDTAEQKDVLIDRVRTNDIAYAGEKVPVDVSVKSAGFQNVPVEVTLRSGAAVVDHARIMLTTAQPVTALHFTVEPEDVGVQQYTVDVAAIPGEITGRNNRRSFAVNVLKSRLKILVVAGAPHADVAAVNGLLRQDIHHEVSEAVEKGPGEWYGRPLDAARIDSADCLVLIGMPNAATSDPVLRLLTEAIGTKHKPFLFIAGKSLDAGKLRQLEPYLPFSIGPARGANEDLVSPMVPEHAKTHSLMMQEGSSFSGGWQRLPPLYRSSAAVRAKPEADVLATAVVQNVPLQDPLIAVRSMTRQRCVGIDAYGVWRWQLMVQLDPSADRLFGDFLNNSVRWLTTEEGEKRVRVVPAGSTMTSSEPVQFAGQVYDEQLRPLDGAEVTVEITRGSEKTGLSMTSVGNGRYEGSVNALGEGEYTYRARARYRGADIGEDRGRFSVGQLNVEFLETRQNKSLLEQIADATGGAYLTASGTDSLPAAIRAAADLRERETVHADEIELWHWQYAGAVIVILLGIEWFMRKRSGMI